MRARQATIFGQVEALTKAEVRAEVASLMAAYRRTLADVMEAGGTLMDAHAEAAAWATKARDMLAAEGYTAREIREALAAEWHG